jgi:S-adenosylmethionine-diacylgycerolhomoserine-N-methlytransferase
MIGRAGEMHVVDFGQCNALPEAFKRPLFAFLKHYTVSPRADLEPTLAAIASRWNLELRFERMHRGYTDYAVLRRR